MLLLALAASGCSQRPDASRVFADRRVSAALESACEGEAEARPPAELTPELINKRGSDGSSPLYWLLRHCKPSPEAVGAFVEAGADPHQFLTDYSISPAIRAIYDLPPEYTAAMLNAGMDPNFRYEEYADAPTLLFHAVKYRENETVRPLLRPGARVNERNASGDTPLLLMRANQYSIGPILLEAGADTTATNKQGANICDVISSSNYTPPESGVDHRERFLDELRRRGVSCDV